MVKDTTETCYNMDDSTFINRTRPDKWGRGVRMYVSKKIENKIRDDLTKFDEESYESLFIELQFQKTTTKKNLLE